MDFLKEQQAMREAQAERNAALFASQQWNRKQSR